MLFLRNLIRSSEEDPVMAFARKWAQTQRLLREFPWMWAVNDAWSPRTSISVDDVTPGSWEEGELGWRYKAFDWWTKVRTIPDDVHIVRKLEFPGMGLRPGAANAIHEVVKLGELVEYIVHKMPYPLFDHYFVFRAPKKGQKNLNKICARIATRPRN